MAPRPQRAKVARPRTWCDHCAPRPTPSRRNQASWVRACGRPQGVVEPRCPPPFAARPQGPCSPQPAPGAGKKGPDPTRAGVTAGRVRATPAVGGAGPEARGPAVRHRAQASPRPTPTPSVLPSRLSDYMLAAATAATAAPAAPAAPAGPVLADLVAARALTVRGQRRILAPAALLTNVPLLGFVVSLSVLLALGLLAALYSCLPAGWAWNSSARPDARAPALPRARPRRARAHDPAGRGVRSVGCARGGAQRPGGNRRRRGSGDADRGRAAGRVAPKRRNGQDPRVELPSLTRDLGRTKVRPLSGTAAP